MEKQRELSGAIPSNFLDNEEFAEIFYDRALRIKKEMPKMYENVSTRSKELLGLEIYDGVKDVNIYVCPFIVRYGDVQDHPRLITLCQWKCNTTVRTQEFTWPMDMIPLSNEERHDIWENFVKNDMIYLQYGEEL